MIAAIVHPSPPDRTPACTATWVTGSGINRNGAASTFSLSTGISSSPNEDMDNPPDKNPMHKPIEQPVTDSPPDNSTELPLTATKPEENSRKNQTIDPDLTTTRGAT